MALCVLTCTAENGTATSTNSCFALLKGEMVKRAGICSEQDEVNTSRRSMLSESEGGVTLYDVLEA